MKIASVVVFTLFVIVAGTCGYLWFYNHGASATGINLILLMTIYSPWYWSAVIATCACIWWFSRRLLF